MSARKRKLTSAFVSRVRTPGKYYDEHGLFLRVSKTGRRYFEQRLTEHGKRRNLGIGRYPVVTLAAARDQALDNLRAVRAGQPVGQSACVPSLAEAAQIVIREATENLRHSRRAFLRDIASFGRYIEPTLGHIPVSKITSKHLIDVLTPLRRKRPSVASRLRGRFGNIMHWAIQHGYRSDNPVNELSHVFKTVPCPPVQHAEAVSPNQVGGLFLDIVHGFRRRNPMMQLWFEFVLYTACRGGEARRATWTEIDDEKKLWVVAPDHLKKRGKHSIPLSEAAVEVLHRAHALAPASEYVFPSARGQPFSESALARAFARSKVECVPHGMRTTVRTWASERGTRWEVCEEALAHKRGNGSSGPYDRAEHISERQELMEGWARFVQDQVAHELRQRGLDPDT